MVHTVSVCTGRVLVRTTVELLSGISGKRRQVRGSYWFSLNTPKALANFSPGVVPTLGKQSQATEPTLKALANCYAAIANGFSVGIDCVHLVPGLEQPLG
jgi:hypothetical protein